MLSLNPIFVAVLVGAAICAAAYGWTAVTGRRRADTAAGVAALAELKWRDFAHLVLEALRHDGYVEEDIARDPGENGFDFVLARAGERYLLVCKHGRTFRLGEAAVRDFATAVRMQSAQGGIIATLGSVEGFGRELARANQVELIDGAMLWQRVAPLMPEPTRQRISAQVDARVRRSMGLSVGVAVVAAAATYLSASALAPSAPVATPAPIARAATPAPSTAALPARAGMPEEDAGEASAHGDDLERRRRDATRQVATMPAFSEVSWSTRSTLVLALRERGEDAPPLDPLIDEACRMLVQYEELRFTRVQLEPAPGDGGPVRWRQCR